MHPDAAYYRKDPVFVRLCAVLVLGAFLLLLYVLIFSHDPACICDDCRDRLDRDPERIEYLERMVER